MTIPPETTAPSDNDLRNSQDTAEGTAPEDMTRTIATAGMSPTAPSADRAYHQAPSLTMWRMTAQPHAATPAGDQVIRREIVHMAEEEAPPLDLLHGPRHQRGVIDAVGHAGDLGPDLVDTEDQRGQAETVIAATARIMDIKETKDHTPRDLTAPGQDTEVIIGRGITSTARDKGVYTPLHVLATQRRRDPAVQTDPDHHTHRLEADPTPNLAADQDQDHEND